MVKENRHKINHIEVYNVKCVDQIQYGFLQVFLPSNIFSAIKNMAIEIDTNKSPASESNEDKDIDNNT